MGRRGPKPGTTGRPKADIARIAIAAHKAGERMSTAVARHYGCSDRAASAAISRARLAGHDIPSDRPLAHGAYRNPHGTVAAFLRHINAGEQVRQPEPLRFVPPPPAPGGPCLTCDCGHTVYLAEHMPGDRMVRHTISEHGRRPHAHERTPREARSEAA